MKSGSAFKKSFVRSSRNGSSMRINFRGNRVYLVGRRGPSGGSAIVILNGKRKRISFYSAKTRNRAVLYSASLSAARSSTLTVVAEGWKGSRKSKGKLVEIDGIGYRG